MKKIILTLTIALITLSTFAQVLPKPSPDCKVEQIVGATNIELNYSREGVKDRVIFGDLVPFEKLWRLGANSATTITTNHSLFFNMEELKAGKYSVFVIPNEDEWEIIFNSDVSASTYSYLKENDVLRVSAIVSENSFTESFTIGFDNLRDTSANIVVLWEKTRVVLPFTLDTEKNSLANIEEAIEKGEDLASVYSNAANYYYGSLKDMDRAMKSVEQSIEIEKTYKNIFLKARILKESGKLYEAIGLAGTALELAESADSKEYINFISGAIESWVKDKKQ